MKIIELLNKIAKGEEVPKKIKYDDDIYMHVDNYCYFCEETNEILSQNIYAECSRLNDVVEIIEEEKEIPIYNIDNMKIAGEKAGEVYRQLYEGFKEGLKKGWNVPIEEEKEIENINRFYDEELEEYVAETHINKVHYKEVFNSRYDEMLINKINELIDVINDMRDKE